MDWPTRYDESYVPPADQPYWFPAMETMDPEQRSGIILEKIQAQMAWAYEHSGLYQRKWKSAGLKPGDIKSLDDFRKTPIITKQDIREDQANHPPAGTNNCVPPSEIGRIHGSSGTTGTPTILAIGKGDWRRIANAHARVMWGMGLRPRDIIFVAAPFSLYLGAWGALAGGERLGAQCFPFGAGNPGQTRMAVRWLRATRPTAFYGTPSFALYLAETAKADGVDPREEFGIRTLFFSGEPGASIPGTRRVLEETYGARVIDSGSTGEMSPWMSNAECTAGAGMHLWQDIVFAEVVDPTTEKVVPYGNEGAPVYTHLDRTSQPMIRFLAGDLARWTNDACPCGRTYPLLPGGVYGRIDDMVVVRGENVYPSAVENVVRQTPGFTGEFRMIVSRERIMDELLVQAEYETEANSGSPDVLADLRTRLAQQLQATLGIRADVDLKAPGELERTQFKARRVIDQRDLRGDRQS